MNSTNCASKKSQTPVAEKTLFGSALWGFAAQKGSDVISWFQKVVASPTLLGSLKSSWQLTSNQSSLRSKLLRGTFASLRPLALRYAHEG
jgi:hypothetical protein